MNVQRKSDNIIHAGSLMPGATFVLREYEDTLLMRLEQFEIKERSGPAVVPYVRLRDGSIDFCDTLALVWKTRFVNETSYYEVLR